MTSNRFAVFILTHGRPDKVYTYESLIRHGYTGDVYFIVDDEDETLPQYEEKFGDRVIVFDKADIEKRFDTADNFTDRRSIVFARNACFEIAKDLGLDYFLQLDDDYRRFIFKFTASLEYQERDILDLDKIFSWMLDFYKGTNALAVAFAQNGDFIGGKRGSNGKKVRLLRKCMNTIFCSTHRPFSFIGRINEDVTAYTQLGRRGNLFLTFPMVSLIQSRTQGTTGGMTDIYKNNGTYLKSFYSVIVTPSAVKVAEMGHKNRRLHHKVTWKNAVPCILDERHKK